MNEKKNMSKKNNILPKTDVRLSFLLLLCFLLVLFVFDMGKVAFFFDACVFHFTLLPAQ